MSKTSMLNAKSKITGYTYGSLGRVTETTDAEGRKQSYLYDL